jgi:hypothetical protein
MTMHRELNPMLFGDQNGFAGGFEPAGQGIDSQRAAPGIMGKPEAPARPAYPPLDVKNLEHQIATLKVALIQMEKRSEAMNSKVEEMAYSVHARMERFAQSIHRIEQTQNQQNQDTTAKFVQVATKVNERRVSDGKIHELIDRHNTIVRNFENRLLSLQRVITEQEMALHNAQAALDEVRMGMKR